MNKFLHAVIVAAIFGALIYVINITTPEWRPNSHEWEGWRGILSGLSFLAGALYIQIIPHMR